MGNEQKQYFMGTEVASLIQKISRHVDTGEYNNNPYEFIEACRLLNNVLPQAVDAWIAAEREAAFQLGVQSAGEGEVSYKEMLRRRKNPLPASGGDA